MKDLTGLKFGRWTVVGFSHLQKKIRVMWKCKCECGKTKAVCAGRLLAGTSKSCGCWRSERISKINFKHGLCGTEVWSRWNGMMSRCYKPLCNGFKNYGGRGIKVCKRWLKFENFFRDMGVPPSSLHTLDRINNSLGYSKSNCRWSTVLEQANNRRTNHFVTAFGKTKTISQWARETGLGKSMIRIRIVKHGYSPEKALTKKSRQHAKK